ncbi:UNKNOWN [Stylonychia lemnae]|uniref:Uncharacterized protein n=1 Tax=Stylonychia lemnae TaxID=5949 RepID=A0A077ZVH8_STYLE|nr:UNKNOWN [Stylonychia lemnae]|eukprot:CDW72431.1 UNKNOWN [Stylonychia lemnae]
MQNNKELCKVQIRSDPFIEDISATLMKSARGGFTLKSEGTLEGSFTFPFEIQEQLLIQSDKQVLAKIELDGIIFAKDKSTFDAIRIKHQGQDYSLSLYFEIQRSTQSEDKLLTLDISVSGLPIKQKCFSCFPAVPLAFYEILTAYNNTQIYESEITRLPSQDPVWMPSGKLSSNQISPLFRVNIYNSSDQQKSRRQLIGGVDIDYAILIDGKEFMFELDGMENTHVLVDRVQIQQ